MSKICKQCKQNFPTYVKIDGKSKKLSRREYCLSCVPHGCRPGRKSTDNILTDTRKEATCTICKVPQPITNFYVRSEKGMRGKARSECKPCLTKYLIERYHKHKLEAIEMLGGKCFDCKNTFIPEVYDFHHLDPSQKDLEWRKIRQCSKVKREAELKKCVLLCSNCHRTRHVNMRLPSL